MVDHRTHTPDCIYRNAKPAQTCLVPFGKCSCKRVHIWFKYGLIMYTNIELKLWNKLHGPIHCKIGDNGVFNGHGLYTLL